MFSPPPLNSQKFTRKFLPKFSPIVFFVSLAITHMGFANAANLSTEFENYLNEGLTIFPEDIENTDGYDLNYFQYDNFDNWGVLHKIEQGIVISSEEGNGSLTYHGNQAIISTAYSEDDDYLVGRVRSPFKFIGNTTFTFDSLKVIIDRTLTDQTTGYDVPVIFEVNHDEPAGSSQFSGDRLEVLLKNQGGIFFFVESNSELDINVDDVFVQASSTNTDDSSAMVFFDASGEMNINSANSVVGIVDINQNAKNSVIGIRSKGNKSTVNINTSNLLLIDNSNIEKSYGIYAISGGNVQLGQKSESLLLKGFNEGVHVESSSLSGQTNFLGIRDSETAFFNSFGQIDIEVEQLFIDNCLYAIDNWYDKTSIKADTAYVNGALSNDGGVLSLDLGDSSYFKGLTFNYAYGEPGQINLTLGLGSIWDVMYDRNSLETEYGLNHVSTLNLDSSIVNLAAAGNVNNFVKIDNLTGSGSFNLLLDTENKKSTEIMTGKNSDGTFAVSVELAQGEFSQIDRNGILFATDESHAVVYTAESSLTEAGLILVTPEIYSQSNNGVTEWYITTIKEEEGPTPDAMLDGFQNNYLFWRTLTDSTKERFGQLRQGQSAGVWGRITAGSLGKGDLSNDYQTYRLGVDTTISPGLSVGVMAEIHEGDLDTSNGSGEMQAYTASLYGLFVSPTGYYADAGLRLGVMDYDYKNTAMLYDKYDYQSTVGSIWLEVGKEWTFADRYTLTPHIAAHYGHFGTENFRTQNNLKATVESVDSLIFTFGTDFGYKGDKFELSAVTDVMSEVSGDQKVRISHNDKLIDHHFDYSDTWMEFGLNAAYKPSENTLIWLNGRRSAFADIDNDWRINAGVRWLFQ